QPRPISWKKRVTRKFPAYNGYVPQRRAKEFKSPAHIYAKKWRSTGKTGHPLIELKRKSKRSELRLPPSHRSRLNVLRFHRGSSRFRTVIKSPFFVTSSFRIA